MTSVLAANRNANDAIAGRSACADGVGHLASVEFPYRGSEDCGTVAARVSRRFAAHEVPADLKIGASGTIIRVAVGLACDDAVFTAKGSVMSDLLPVLSRWVHVGAAIVLVGGSVFMRFALMPAAGQLPEDVHHELRERVMGTWRKFVGVGILLLLASGIYNFLLAMPTERVQASKLYHPLMGVKIMLALVIFFLASALTGRSKALEKFRQNARLWLGVNILLAAVVVAIAGYLKVAVQAPLP